MKLLQDRDLKVGSLFYPFLSTKFPNVGEGVGAVTIEELLQMRSGMVADNTLSVENGDVWAFWRGISRNPQFSQKIPPYAPTPILPSSKPGSPPSLAHLI